MGELVWCGDGGGGWVGWVESSGEGGLVGLGVGVTLWWWCWVGVGG